MAEQNSRHVVDQTLSGGDPSPSDVPASTIDKTPAIGDAGEKEYTTPTTQTDIKPNAHQSDWKAEISDSPIELNEAAKDTGRSSADIFKQSPGPVASRALELNGIASTSDGGDDTASQGGSESDASRTDGRSHARAGSVKRPATFKPVSFAKFSVPKAPGTPTAPKVSDKVPVPSAMPLGAPQQTSRPRLVAKTTSNLRDAISKAGTSGAKPAGAGPDPSQVWNKNRPTQPPPAKHLTDEELKQQYGIHMTSRIQEDGGGTEAKWADIDDDEDDWAPETIEWTDGTKTSLTNTEPPVPIHEHKIDKEPKPASPPPEQAPSPKETSRPIPKPTTSIGPNPTVLRLGANADRQARSAGVSPKSAIAKLYPSSTSPAPPPARSPWAPLPPVDRTSPITQPVQLQPSHRVPSREHPVHDGLTGPPPPKEIAADDFNRSWREIQTGAPRELYNSRSGRYEPVPETKKGPWRSEQHFRAPSVLQRPAHNEQMGPAEPSPAFQTRRSSAQDGGHWQRRRTSSNVSGGSGAFGRRTSFGRVDNMHPKPAFEVRRGSQVNGMADKDATVQEISHIRQAQAQGWQRRTSANLNEAASDATGMAPPPSAPAPPEEPAGADKENPVAMQERIMKEKRMEARQRRLEQEEREEAAKRERIRQKLEALGPAPEKPKRSETMESSKPEEGASAAAATSQSPPKPPVPERTGEPKQYGMMKVHHPDSVKRLVATNEREKTGDKGIPMSHTRRMPSSPREDKPDAAITDEAQQMGDSQMPTPGKPSEPRVDDQSSQWKSSLNVHSPYSPWSSNTKLGGTSPSLTNLWKPLSNDRTLGNGIFEQSLGGFPTRDLPLRSHFGLEPPSVAPSSQPFPATSKSPEEDPAKSPLPSPEVKHAAYDSLNPIGHPGPIGPPSSQPSQWQQDVRPTGTAAWNNFHVVAAKREAEENERIRQEMSAMRDTPSTLQVSFNETWRQVRTGDQTGQRQVIGINRPTDGTPPSHPLPGFDHSVGGLPFADNPVRPLGSVPARSSRFFPPASEQPKRPEFEEEEAGRSPSPPPPEEISSHPAFTGDSRRPLVHLPGPKPVVKLPPKAIAPSPSPPTFASMAATTPHMAAPSTAMSWQEKIYGLFGKKTIPEKKSVLAVSSASKEPLDVARRVAAVSVSLPQVEGGFQPGDGDMSAQQVEEAEAIFEDREAGSLPEVRVPNMAPPAAWLAAPRPPQSRRAKTLKPMQVHSVEPYSFGFDKDSSGHVYVSLRFPGAILAKSLPLPKKAGGHYPRHRGYPNFKPRRGPKLRDGHANFNSKKTVSFHHAEGSDVSGRRPSSGPG